MRWFPKMFDPSDQMQYYSSHCACLCVLAPVYWQSKAGTAVLRIPDHSCGRITEDGNKHCPLKDSLELFFFDCFPALGWYFGVHSNHWSLLSGTAQHRTWNRKTHAIWVSSENIRRQTLKCLNFKLLSLHNYLSLKENWWQWSDKRKKKKKAKNKKLKQGEAEGKKNERKKLLPQGFYSAFSYISS